MVSYSPPLYLLSFFFSSCRIFLDVGFYFESFFFFFLLFLLFEFVTVLHSPSGISFFSFLFLRQDKENSFRYYQWMNCILSIRLLPAYCLFFIRLLPASQQHRSLSVLLCRWMSGTWKSNLPSSSTCWNKEYSPIAVRSSRDVICLLPPTPTWRFPSGVSNGAFSYCSFQLGFSLVALRPSLVAAGAACDARGVAVLSAPHTQGRLCLAAVFTGGARLPEPPCRRPSPSCRSPLWDAAATSLVRGFFLGFLFVVFFLRFLVFLLSLL